MRTTLQLVLFVTACFGTMTVANAATFAYHGTLQDGGKPAEGKYDLELTLYSASAGGSAIGGPLLLYAVPVHAGSFSTEADFGPSTRVQGDAWLAVKVRAAGSGEFAALSARSAVTAAAATSVCPGAWTLAGNAGNPAGSYLGTADSQPLIFEVNSAQVGRLTSNIAGHPNVVFGPATNSAAGAAASVTISGGAQNSGGDDAVIGGGYGNFAADSSVVGGGHQNIASGYAAVIPGGVQNTAGGNYSFAGGQTAYVRPPADVGGGNTTGDQGTFVWNDTTTGADPNPTFSSTGPNQFLVHAAGGVGINAPPVAPGVEFTLSSMDGVANMFLHAGTATDGILVSTGAGSGTNNASFSIDNYDGLIADTHRRFFLNGSNGFVALNSSTTPAFPFVVGSSTKNGNGAHINTDGTYSSSSSRDFKEGFAAIDPTDILQRLVAMPIQTWQYKGAATGRHLGPVAEDFKATFGLGYEDRYITTVDEEGVALAAIQGLNEKVEAENARLKRENADVHAQLDQDRRELADVLARLSKLERQHGE
jgi:hypothetical protein